MPEHAIPRPTPQTIRLPRTVVTTDLQSAPIPPRGVVLFDLRETAHLQEDAVPWLLRLARQREVHVVLAADSQPYQVLIRFFPPPLMQLAEPEIPWLTGDEWILCADPAESPTRWPRLVPETLVQVSLGVLLKWAVLLFVAGGFAYFGRDWVVRSARDDAANRYVTKDAFAVRSLGIADAQTTIKEDVRELKVLSTEQTRRLDRIETIVERLAFQAGVPVPAPTKHKIAVP